MTQITTTLEQSSTTTVLAAEAIPQLFVNDGALTANEMALLEPIDPKATSLEEVRRKLQEDGHVFLKGLLPVEDVLKAREAYFNYLKPTGFLKPNTEPLEGIFDSTKDPADYPGIGAGGTTHHSPTAAAFTDLALKAHAEPWYKDVFCKIPQLRDYIAQLTQWGSNTLGVERTLLRNNLPGAKAIGVHYDYIFLRHGDESVLTAWVPMGDIKLEGGGLIYLEKGHELGRKIEQEFTAKALATHLSEEEAKFAFNKNMMAGGVLSDGPAEFGRRYQRRWLVANYEAGDVVLHDSCAIHASTVNHDPDGVIRLGTDLRFVDKSSNWDTRWQKVFELGDGL